VRKEAPSARPRRRASLQAGESEPEQPAEREQPAQQHPAESFPESRGPVTDLTPERRGDEIGACRGRAARCASAVGHVRGGALVDRTAWL